MPKTNVKANTWIADLRRQIKRKCMGWKVQEQSGKARIFHKLEDGSRPSVTTEIEWKESNSTAIQNEVVLLMATMAEQSCGIKDAYARIKQVHGVVTGNGIKSAEIDWQAIADDFLATKTGHRKTTLRDTQSRINKALTLFSQRPRPTDGSSLMKSYAKTYFSKCPAGGNGRKRGLGDIAAFLNYAVDKAGAPSRWMPLEGASRDVLIGTSDKVNEGLTPPVKPEQLAGLLDSLLSHDKPELWLAVALVGCFGLRPAELAALSIEDGKLYVSSQVKRNARSMKKAITKRRVLALELDSRSDGASALRKFDEGLINLPKALRTAVKSGEYKKVGDTFRQLLDRNPYWQSMVNNNSGLTPYSLRHGWAWRAHKGYDRPLSVRDAAALLGHSPATHHKHYGRWVDEKGLEEAVEGLVKNKSKTKEA